VEQVMNNNDSSLHQPGSYLPYKIIVGEVEAPLAELLPYDGSPAGNARPVQLDSSVVKAIGDIVRVMPGVVGIGSQALTQTYLLKFAPDVAAQLQAGTATVMQSLQGGVRAVAVDANGKILGNGTLVAARGLSSAATAIMFWQTLTVITAQHYLHDMQKQLRELHTAVEDMHDTLLAKEFALLFSHERYLQRTIQIIQRGAANELDISAMSAQLDQMERECDQVQQVMHHLMERQFTRLQSAPLKAVFPWNVKRNVDHAKKHVDAFDQAAQGYVAAARMRAMIAMVRAKLLLQTQTSLSRLQEIDQDSYGGRVLMVRFYDLINSRGSDVWARLEFKGTLDDFRAKLAEQVLISRYALRHQFDRLEADVTTVEQHLLTQSRMVAPALFVQQDAAGVIHVYEAPETTDSHQAGSL
jgi:hypothetical protein